MASFSSSKLNEEKYTKRSDSLRMYNIDRIPLVQLRSEKLDDAAIYEQILFIQDICRDVSPDDIAMIFHECDYNIQNTIARINSGEFSDGGWRIAKPTNKKKIINNHADQISNDCVQIDNEHGHSQHTFSSSSSFRDNVKQQRRRQDQYQYSSSYRSYSSRRGNISSRNQYYPFNSHNSLRNHQNMNKSKQQNTNETVTKENTSIKTPITCFPIEEFEFFPENTPTLTFNSSSIKKSSLPVSKKCPKPSSIPQEPVVMHPMIEYSKELIDIQFGDIQGNEFMSVVNIPSNSSIKNSSLDDQNSLVVVNTNDNKQNIDVHRNHQWNEEIDRTSDKVTNEFLSSSISSTAHNTTITNSSMDLPLQETSHLSDSLKNQIQQRELLETPVSSSLHNTAYISPPLSTTDVLQHTSTISEQNITYPTHTNHSTTTHVPFGNQSTFTPYNTAGIYSDYPQTNSMWNQQQPNYKTNPKGTLMQLGNYHQQASYPIQHSQQFLVGTYPVGAASFYPIMSSMESWSTANLENYPFYPTTNYPSLYPTQQHSYPTAQLQSTKYDRSSYEKESFAYYGQTRSSNNDLSNSSQPIKDISRSKLSANAASFSQGASLSTSTTFCPSSIIYAVPPYYTTHHEQSMAHPPFDNYDNRNGAFYIGNNNRSYNRQHQRTTYNNLT